MSLGSSLRRAVRAATSGVPRLYAAARSAGADHRDAAALVSASASALMVAARRHPHEWRRQNAVRHFAWQALLTARYGVEMARALADAHERGSSDAVDSSVDRANNAAGQAYGAAHAAQLRRGPVGATLTHLVEVAEREWAAGRLSSPPRRDG
ncbi:DUF6973 domain-containing protein [uncultured Nocardioides sp.]|uniref:DUF6973 domain-containing protein n=1 Tax=uncultured Nocardioides sp. TaxID=198441 RepID=A0A6J4N3T1_9ACTN|nr:hypothetical protein [uncultured Nocardioides sp.]CAA9375686.1 MAG: hypothetical protein AVDCRST_MAG06-475 [uncultured Nocardioides sp.]